MSAEIEALVSRYIAASPSLDELRDLLDELRRIEAEGGR